MIRRFTIGRDRSSDVPVADDSVSRTHAEIWLAPDGALILADRGSSNGTELIRDGQTTPFKEGAVLCTDQVRFGAVTLAIKDVIEAIELKHPGALTDPPEPPKAAPPPIPSLRPPSVPPPPPRLPPLPNPPALPGGAQSPPRAVAGPLVRCDCGAIKTLGQTCPGCHR